MVLGFLHGQKECILNDSAFNVEVQLRYLYLFAIIIDEFLVDVETWVSIDLENPGLKLFIDQDVETQYMEAASLLPSILIDLSRIVELIFRDCDTKNGYIDTINLDITCSILTLSFPTSTFIFWRLFLADVNVLLEALLIDMKSGGWWMNLLFSLLRE